MFRQLLEFGSVFDWISPVVAGILDVANGPSHQFAIPRDCGWSGHEIETLLRRHGIRTWGLMIPAYSDTIAVTVRQSQAQWAQYVLQQQGIPLKGGLLADASSSRGQGSPTASPSGLAGADDWIDRLGDLLWS
jgi:hypothetical protein